MACRSTQSRLSSIRRQSRLYSLSLDFIDDHDAIDQELHGKWPQVKKQDFFLVQNADRKRSNDDIFQIGYSVIINISYFGVGSCYTMSSVILAALQKPDAEFFVSKEAGSWIGKTKNKGSRWQLAYNSIKKTSKLQQAYC